MSAQTGAPGPQSRLGPAALVALLVMSLVAGIYVYRARTPDLALEVVEFDRRFDEGSASFEFFVRFDDPAATIEMVGRDQVVAKTLAGPIELTDQERIACEWNGLDDEGDPVEPGRYRLRVTLPEQDRVMVFPRRLTIDRAPAAPGFLEEAAEADSCEPGGES